MNTYQLTEADGTDWGLWAAESSADAVAQLMQDIETNPDAYCGMPTSPLTAA